MPWYHDQFTYVRDTPYDLPSAEAVLGPRGCSINRGTKREPVPADQPVRLRRPAENRARAHRQPERRDPRSRARVRRAARRPAGVDRSRLLETGRRRRRGARAERARMEAWTRLRGSVACHRSRVDSTVAAPRSTRRACRPGSTSSRTSRCCRPARRRARRWSEWSFALRGAVDATPTWSWRRAAGAAAGDVHRRHPLRHEVVEARHDVDRRLDRHAAARDRDRGRVRHRLQRRRLHDEHAAGGPHRRQGVGRAHVRGRAARPRARRPRAPARPAPVLLEERQVGARADAHAGGRAGLLGGRAATTTSATPGESSATGATDVAVARARADRLAHRRRARADPRDGARLHDRLRRARLARPPRRPARRRAPHRRGRLPGRALLLDRVRAGGSAARADDRADRRRRGLALPRRRAAAGRRVRAARPDRRAIHVGRRRRAARCCWSAAARGSCR